MLRFLATLALTFLAATAIVLIARPALRAAIVAEWNDPANLPALQSDPRIHHEPSARECAERVARLLPVAITRIEGVHGRPFAQPPTIGVYASFATYARANGLGDAGVAGVTRAGRALLSPTLCGNESARLESVLTHELSHVHFSGWRTRGSRLPPAWFAEGLAVMASDGGGAEGVSDEEAVRSIRSGVAIVPDDASWLDFSAIRFTREPVASPDRDPMTYRQRLAFRQAGLFVSWLQRQEREAFRRLLRDLERGAAFETAFAGSFDERWQNYWRRFIEE